MAQDGGRAGDSGRSAQRGEAAGDRIVTVPNLLSALRLVGVPVFVWLLAVHADGWALAVLALSGVTDYLDGKIARRYGLVSRLGELLDPAADRLYTLATIIAFAWRGIIPLWLLVALLARDLVMGVVVLALRRVGRTGLPVHFVGKAATFNLLYAFPVLLLAQVSGAVGTVALPVGWAFTWWGVALYWLAAVLYVVQATEVLRGSPSRAALGTG